MIPGRRRIRVLVVDDSVVIRRLVADVLSSDPQIEVVGTADNGEIAVERTEQLRPDAVTMDIEMPRMDGIAAVRALRARGNRVPIVMFSTLTERGASATLDALAAGASDYVTKPSNVRCFEESKQNVRDQLIPKLIALTSARRLLAARPVTVPPPRPVTARAARGKPFAVLGIGCSTGGPDALAKILPALPGDLPVPVVLVQHMPPLFTKMLAQRLDHTSAVRVREAEEGEPLEAGTVLVAPGGRHLEVRSRGAIIVAHLSDAPPENFCRPAVDVLFRSLAAIYRDRSLAVVLTGMGRDGERGARAIRETGGEVFVQDQATSVVWGMPGAVATAGQADRILPLQQVAGDLAGALGRRPTTMGAFR